MYQTEGRNTERFLYTYRREFHPNAKDVDPEIVFIKGCLIRASICFSLKNLLLILTSCPVEAVINIYTLKFNVHVEFPYSLCRLCESPKTIYIYSSSVSGLIKPIVGTLAYRLGVRSCWYLCCFDGSKLLGLVPNSRVIQNYRQTTMVGYTINFTLQLVRLDED